MLKTECPNCSSWVHLPFHGNVEETTCPDCGSQIPVKDVYVSAGPFLIFRDILLKNMYKYKRLILEAEKEIEDLKKRGDGIRTYDVSVNTMTNFLGNLKEMLDGCRNSTRHPLGERSVLYTINKQEYQGRLVNLSVTGACIDCGKISTLAKLWNDIELHFEGDGTEGFSIQGKTMWIGNGNLMGVKFVKNEDSTARQIESLILQNNKLI
ncbi:MAG: PilZ domain-containing protein [Deltaproteobacteria bacterium]|nr:PilZ domain-containing protein [Deltaproteobacteria bacterium]